MDSTSARRSSRTLVGEDLDVRIGIRVADRHDVELPRVGQRANSEGLVSEEVQQREHLDQPRTGEVAAALCGPGRSALTTFTRCRTMSLSIAPRTSLLWNIVPSDGRPIAFRLAVSAAICRSLRLRIGDPKRKGDDHLADQISPVLHRNGPGAAKWARRSAG